MYVQGSLAHAAEVLAEVLVEDLAVGFGVALQQVGDCGSEFVMGQYRSEGAVQNLAARLDKAPDRRTAGDIGPVLQVDTLQLLEVG